MEHTEVEQADGPQAVERCVIGKMSGRANMKVPDHIKLPKQDTRTQAEKSLDNFLERERQEKIKVLEGRLQELDTFLEGK